MPLATVDETASSDPYTTCRIRRSLTLPRLRRLPIESHDVASRAAR